MAESNEDEVMAWRLQEEELHQILGFPPREVYMPRDDTHNETGMMDTTNDKMVAQDMENRQIAYKMQLDEDAAMAREISSSYAPAQPFSPVGNITTEQLMMADDMATAHQLVGMDDETTARELAMADDEAAAQELVTADDEAAARQLAVMEDAAAAHEMISAETAATALQDAVFAQDIETRQTAYMLQLDEDAALARSLADKLDVNDHPGYQGLPIAHNHRAQCQPHHSRDQRGRGHRGQGHRGHHQPPLAGGHIAQLLDSNISNDYEALMDLAEQLGEARNPGLEANQIDTLPTQVYNTPPLEGATGGASDDSSTCKVCLDDFNDGDTMRSLPCLHKYHKTCIDEWLQRKASCPVCNLEVRDALT